MVSAQDSYKAISGMNGHKDSNGVTSHINSNGFHDSPTAEGKKNAWEAPGPAAFDFRSTALHYTLLAHLHILSSTSPFD